MNEITVADLFVLLKKELLKGNASKKILLSNDDEGNGYHFMYFGVTPTTEFAPDDFNYLQMPHGVTNEEVMNDCIILG